MIVRAVVETAPWWAVVLASAGSGSVVGLIGYLSNRKIRPAQQRQLELAAEKTAVEIVESALKIAQERIQSLDNQVKTLTSKIDELRLAVSRSDQERSYARKQLDLALAQRAELQHQLIELTRMVGERRVDHLMAARPSDAIVIVDLRIDGKISYANDGVFSLLGYAPSELIGQSISMLVPEDFRASHAIHRKQYDADPVTRQMGGTAMPLFARRRDGSSIPVNISLHPTGDGRVIALILRRDVSSPTLELAAAGAVEAADAFQAAPEGPAERRGS